MHRLLLHNDEILDAGLHSVSPGQVGLLNGWGVFSTIRVCDGDLFAFSRHWDRMKNDARKLRVPFPANADWMHSRLLKLVDANAAHNATLRVAVVRNRGGLFEAPGQSRDFDLIAFTADITAWPEGVRLGTKPQARHAGCEFAGAKIISWAHNLAWYEEAHERGLDEYVLLNERGEVCECTSANIFAVFDAPGHAVNVWTPPLSSGCLGGVTRAILLEEIRIQNLQIAEKPLLPSDLERAAQVFITSTTRDLLPVLYIDGRALRTDGGVVKQLQEAFLAYRQASHSNASSRPVAMSSQ